MGFVGIFDWTNATCVNAVLTLSMYVDSTGTADDVTIFSEQVPAINNGFFYSIPDAYFLDNTVGSGYSPLRLKISAPNSQINGDANNSELRVGTFEVRNQLIQQEYFTTNHNATLEDRTSSISTIHSVFIDRIESFGGSSSYLFWDSSRLTEVSDITNIEYAYDKEPTSTFAIIPQQSSGNVHLVRSTAACTGIKGVVHLDASAIAGSEGADLTVYIDNTSYNTGPLNLGTFNFYRAKSGRIQSTYSMPDDRMREFSDVSFVGTDLYLKNNTTNYSVWGILDSYITFIPSTPTYMDTSHSVLVADTTTPVSSHIVETTHKARIKRGKVYVIDYYRPGEWWNFENKTTYTYNDWNNYEILAQYFGRFFHSPLYYGTQFPDFGTITFTGLPNGTFSITKDYGNGEMATAITDKTIAGGTKGFNIIPWVSSLLKVYAPVITPHVFEDDGTFYQLEPFVADNTIGVYIKYNGGGIYVYWNGTGTHPFKDSPTFRLSFYSKKG